MLGLPALAMGVQALGQFADQRLLLGAGVGEGEGFEAAGLVIAGVIADTEAPAGGQGPRNMDAT
ncbi:hypothetical protein D3C80_2166750 [compost metagenome]